MTTPLLVTGASGQLGRRVLELLLDRKAGPLIATTRHPEQLADFAKRGVEVRRADFDDSASLAAAFKGAERALLISTDALDTPGKRLAQHQRAVQAFVEAGVKHVVYTSLPNAAKSAVAFGPDHAGTEAALEKSGLGFTVLRNSYYTDLTVGGFQHAVATGQLVDAKGSGKTSFITREDCAWAAAGALAGSETGRHVYTVHGPQSLSSDDVAALLSRLSGKKVVHVNVGVAEVTKGIAAAGVPEPIAAVFATFDTATANGDFEGSNADALRFANHPQTTLEQFLTGKL